MHTYIAHIQTHKHTHKTKIRETRSSEEERERESIHLLLQAPYSIHTLTYNKTYTWTSSAKRQERLEASLRDWKDATIMH